MSKQERKHGASCGVWNTWRRSQRWRWINLYIVRVPNPLAQVYCLWNNPPCFLNWIVVANNNNNSMITIMVKLDNMQKSGCSFMGGLPKPTTITTTTITTTPYYHHSSTWSGCQRWGCAAAPSCWVSWAPKVARRRLTCGKRWYLACC